MRWLLLKDLQILRRSKLLVGLLIIYPIAIATLMGFALSSGPDKPRVAYLDQVPAQPRDDPPRQAEDQHPRVHERAARARSSRYRSSTATRRSRRSARAAVLAALIIPPDFARSSPTAASRARASRSSTTATPSSSRSWTRRSRPSSRSRTRAVRAGHAAGLRLHRRIAQRRRDRRARDALPDPRPEGVDERIDATLADHPTAANKRRLGPVSEVRPPRARQRRSRHRRARDRPGAGQRAAHDPQRPPHAAGHVRRGRRRDGVADVRVRPARVGLLALEREENTFSRLARGLVSRLADLRSRRRARGGLLVCRHARDAARGEPVRAAGPGRSDSGYGACGRGIAFATLGVAIGSPGPRGACGVAAGLRARASARLPRARAQRRRVAAALRRHPHHLGDLPVQASLQAIDAAVNGSSPGIGQALAHLAALIVVFGAAARAGLSRFA